jgi:hypothetical protein
VRAAVRVRVRMTQGRSGLARHAGRFLLSGRAGGSQVRFYHEGWPSPNDHWRTSCFCWAMYCVCLRRFLEHGKRWSTNGGSTSDHDARLAVAGVPAELHRRARARVVAGQPARRDRGPSEELARAIAVAVPTAILAEPSSIGDPVGRSILLSYDGDAGPPYPPPGPGGAPPPPWPIVGAGCGTGDSAGSIGLAAGRRWHWRRFRRTCLGGTSGYRGPVPWERTAARVCDVGASARCCRTAGPRACGWVRDHDRARERRPRSGVNRDPRRRAPSRSFGPRRPRSAAQVPLRYWSRVHGGAAEVDLHSGYSTLSRVGSNEWPRFAPV